MRRSKLPIALLAVAIAAGALWWLTGRRSGSGLGDPSDAAQVARGQAVYVEHCASCHGADLHGEPNWRERLPSGMLPAPPHDETGHTWHHPDQQLFQIIEQGTAALVPPGYATSMTGFGDRLTDEDIWAVLAYIKSRWPAPIRERQAEISRVAGDR